MVAIKIIYSHCIPIRDHKVSWFMRLKLDLYLINSHMIMILNPTCSFRQFLTKCYYYSNILNGISFFHCFSKMLAFNFDLYFLFLGLVLNRYPQQGHQNPSHIINTSHTWHRFCPTIYRPTPVGFWALRRIHLPLHVIRIISPNWTVCYRLLYNKNVLKRWTILFMLCY